MNVTDNFTQDELRTYFTWLDNLRESASVNMFGAYPLLASEFGLAADQARAVWSAWAQTFHGRLTAARRVEQLFQQAGL